MINLEEILCSDDVVLSLRDNLDYLICYIPELRFVVGFDQKNPYHNLDVWEHTLKALSVSENDFELRLALLLHDIGKPFSYQDDGDIRHFYGHPRASALLSKIILERLGYEEDFIKRIYYLVDNHDDILHKVEVDKNYDLAYKIMLMQECDSYAHTSLYIKNHQKYLKK